MFHQQPLLFLTKHCEVYYGPIHTLSALLYFINLTTKTDHK